MRTRRTAYAGTWYPAHPRALAADIDEYVAGAELELSARPLGLVCPHAGLMFSGPVAACAYKLAALHEYDVAFVVGPSHYAAFEGMAVWPAGQFVTPLGAIMVDERGASDLLRDPLARDLADIHAREHSLEMQLPFMRHLSPGLPIVPVVMGYQDRHTIEAVAGALASAATDRRALLVASSDLSHFFDAGTAARLDGRVGSFVEQFDPEGLLGYFEQYPDGERGRYVACGGGPIIAVMLAARSLGARHGRVLHYAHSGHVSGDNQAVVGYMAAALFAHIDPSDAH